MFASLTFYFLSLYFYFFCQSFWKLLLGCSFTFCYDYFIYMFVRCVCLLSNCPYDSTPALKSQYLLCLFFAKIAISCFPTPVNYSKKSPIIFTTISTIGCKIPTSITEPTKNAERLAESNQLSTPHYYKKNPQTKLNYRQNPQTNLTNDPATESNSTAFRPAST